MNSPTEYETILDVNGNALLPGEELLLFSKRHPLPFYVTVRRNAAQQLCIDIDNVETLIRDLIDPSQEDIEITIPLHRYEFELVK